MTSTYSQVLRLADLATADLQDSRKRQTISLAGDHKERQAAGRILRLYDEEYMSFEMFLEVSRGSYVGSLYESRRITNSVEFSGFKHFDSIRPSSELHWVNSLSSSRTQFSRFCSWYFELSHPIGNPVVSFEISHTMTHEDCSKEICLLKRHAQKLYRRSILLHQLYNLESLS